MNKVSIIIPVYKVEMYLSRCLESIINQIYTEWEAILIDDCSPDKSGEICDEYAEKDGRFRVVHLEASIGASACRNHGLMLATGYYVTFVDADDYVTEKYLRTLVKDLESNDADICQCSFYHVVNGEIQEDVKKIGATAYPVDVYTGEEAFGHCYGDGDVNLFSFLRWNKIFKKEILDGVQFKGIGCEDAIFISEAFLKARKVSHSDKRRYYYCRHDESDARETKNDVRDMIKSHILAYREVVKVCEGESQYSQALSQAMLGKWYASAIKHRALDGDFRKMLKEDNLKYKLSKNKRLSFFRRLALKVMG